MWTILILFITILSIVVSIKIKFNNFNISKMIKCINKDKSSLFMSLGSKIGVGSIIGTISSILIGGYSSYIWMIIFSIITSSLIYYEAYLGKKYNTNYVSGPHIIIDKITNNKVLYYISISLLIVTYSFFFQMIQSNTISSLLNINYNINKIVIAISTLILLLITIKLSIKDVINIMNKLVPFMCILFIIVSLYGIISNIDILFTNIKQIELFNINSILIGMVIGIKRSIFMNELLVGTTSVASGIDKNSIEESCTIQVIGMFFISFIITTLVTLLLIISNSNSINYINTLSNMYLYSTGNIGLFIITITILLFAVTTILGGYYIAVSNIKNNKCIFDILFIISIVSSIFINNSIIWKYTDILLIFMILINSYSIIKSLRKC